jgi:hypothetical protein
MSTNESLTNNVSSIDFKQVGRFVAVLIVYSIVFFASILVLASMGRTAGGPGSLALAVFTVGGLLTAIHYVLAGRGW